MNRFSIGDRVGSTWYSESGFSAVVSGFSGDNVIIKTDDGKEQERKPYELFVIGKEYSPWRSY